MHCHVLMHMSDGMMGSLLVVKRWRCAVPLPQGVPCPPDLPAGAGAVDIQRRLLHPTSITILTATVVRWTNRAAIFSTQ